MLVAAAAALMLCSPVRGQVAGQNVNMVSGTDWTNGDPFLQRQNEPSIAVSTRNTSHLFAGANDYRAVDLPGLLGIDERGDAWLGVFKSFDAGRTWQSTLLPGFPLDGSPEGLQSPIHGFQAASDPAVRAGTNGLFYYVGLAYNRGTNPLSAVFVSRFIDLNNKENGDASFENSSMTNLTPRDPIKYLDTTVLDKGNPYVFLDKPWVAVDIPRHNSTCTISAVEDGQTVTQRIPAGAVYVTYTAFVSGGPFQFSNILFRKSTDCGASWSFPRILSRNDDFFVDAEHQGTVIAIDPSVPADRPAKIYVAWRRFSNPGDPDDASAIFLAQSQDGGETWSAPSPIVVFPKSCNTNPTGTGCPFDQIFTTASFRSNGYPALTVDDKGRVYVAWSQRDENGDGKIMIGVSSDGWSFSRGSVSAVDLGPVTDDNGNPFTNLSGRGSQLMPSLKFSAGKLTMAYYDLRQDHTTGAFASAPEPTCDATVVLPCELGAQYTESRTLEGELAPPNADNNPAVFGPYVEDVTPPLTVRRHTIDLMAAEAVPESGWTTHPPTFKSFRVSHYEFGSIPQLFADVEQIQFNTPNLPIFVDGTAPFMGDYIDVTGTPEIVPNGKGGWEFNTSSTANPVFHTAWTDNRDVIPPADGNWQNYTPPISASNPGGQPSKFDPTTTPPACVVGETGMRNQNIYTSEISQGVILTSPQTSKPVLTPTGQPIQREFVVEVRNATNSARSFQLAIPSQPASATASFLQFALQTTQIVKVNAFSSQSLAVFVAANPGSTVAFPSVLVTATENDGGSPALTGSLLLNPDPTNPALTSPDSVLVGASQIAVDEYYNPGVANPGVASPGVANPGIANPGVANPGVASPGVANPDVIVALKNPGVASPGVANPGVANPGVANPGVANEAVTDASYAFTNEGNTSAAYTIQLFQSAPFPAGAQFQIILSKLYFTTQANGCQLEQVANNVILANVINPAFVTDPTQLGNPGVANLNLQTPTLNLAPGESGQVTIRTNLPPAQVISQVLPNLSPVVVSQGVNTVDVQQGITTPPVNLVLTTVSLPASVTTQAYNATLTSIGGTGGNSAPRTWSIVSGSLPPGLQLNPATGAITGTPTATGTFPFTAQVTDTGTPQHTATRNLSITVVVPVAITTPSPTLPNAIVGFSYLQTFSATGGSGTYTWSSTGTLPPGLTLSSNGALSGFPTTAGGFSFSVTATDTLGFFATAPYSIVVIAAPPTGTTLTFLAQPSNTVGAQAITPPVQVQVLDPTGAPIPNVPITISFANQACPSATLSGTLIVNTNPSGTASFSNLSVDHGQRGYTLLAAAANDTATSTTFNIEGYCDTGSVNAGRHNHNVIALPNGKVVVLGGAVNPDNTGALSSAELYDPIAHTFNAIGNMHVARVDFTMTLLQNATVLITGGFNDSGILSSAEIFDPSNNTFTLLPAEMTSPRAEHIATLLANGKVLITGGNATTTVTLATAELFDPSTNTFTGTSHPMNAIRQIQHADLLPNGQVLVSGGFDTNGNPLASAELYDPVADTFTLTGSMNVARGNHASTLLYTGQVLVAGGLAVSETGLARTTSAELYNPATGTWSVTGSMNVPRAHYFANTLSDGTIFIPGSAVLPVGNNADIFDPATGTFRLTANFTIDSTGEHEAVLQDGTVLLASGVDINNVVTTNSEIFYPLTLPSTITVTTTAVANATEDAPYTQLLLERGGVGTLTWTLASGALPPGITLSASGILAGKATAPGTFNFTVQVADSATPQKIGTSGTLTIIVTGVPLQFTSSAMPGGGSGRFYSQPLPFIGGTPPYTVTQTAGTLPPGLSLSSNGMLEGTPSAAGSFTFTAHVTDSSSTPQSATRTLTITIDTLFITTTVLPDGIVGVPYNASIATAGGTLPLTFSAATAAFPPGLTIQQPGAGSQNGALAGTPTQAGTFTFSESVTDSSNPVQTATQNYIVAIAPLGTAAPANVNFVSNPQTSVGGQTLAGSPVIVSVTDASNNPIAGASVVLSLSGEFSTPLPCSTAALNGNLSGLTGANGQVTFSNLSIDRGGFNYVLMASAGSASNMSTPFHVQGFCATGNLSTQREFHTQTLLGTAQSILKFPLDPKGAYIFTNTNPAPPGIPDLPDPPLIIPLASLGLGPGSVISGVSVGDMNFCDFAGESCFGEVFNGFTCGVFSSSNTLLPSGGTINRIPGAIAPNFNTAFPCNTPPTDFGNLPTDIPQDFAFFGEPVTVPNGAAYLFVAVTDSFYSDNSDPNGDFGLQLTINSPATNGKVLIAGGNDNNGNALNTAELYDPVSGTTSPTGNLSDPNGRTAHISVLLPNGKVLLAGGSNNISGALTTAELYDPATGTFSPTGTMAHPRALAEAVLLADGRVLVTGGNGLDTNVGINTAEIYDPATGLWTPTGNMTQARIRHAMTLLPNGKVLVTGGRDAAQNFFGLSSAELFDPFANQGVGAFTFIGNMNSPRFVHTATLLPNGTVLIAGGFNDGNESFAVNSAEIFDYRTNVFTPTGSMSTPRARYTSTLLPDGTALEVGGTNRIQGVTAPAPAEIYSATTGSFAETGLMTIGRELHRATRLFNGNVLVSGGDDGVNVLATTEVYYNPVVKEPITITTTSVPNGFISQPYVQLLLDTNTSGPVTWSLASGTLPPGVNLGANGFLTGTPTATGSFTFTAQVTDGISTGTASFTINVSVATLAFTSNTMPAGGVGRPYSQPLPVTGGTLPYTATVTSGSLPTGLALSTNGVVSGTPASAGTFTFTVNVTDASTPTQAASQTLTMSVNNLVITTTALPDGIVGVPYNAPISTDGGTLPLTFSAATAAFPPGLTIQQPAANSQSGALSGTPTLAGHYTFTGSVTDSSTPAQTATQYYTMDIFPAGLTATPATVTFLTQPQNSVGGQILGGSPVRVHVADANNAPISGASVAISFNGAPPCATAVLSGTLTGITNGNGNAVFPDLSIDRGQLGYTLLASAGSTSAVSQLFTVNGFCETGNMSVARRFGTATLLPNGKVLITGGRSLNPLQYLTSAELYDPSSGQFTLTGSMSVAREFHTATLLPNGTVLIAGGDNSVSPALSSGELYDPATGAFTLTGSMNAAHDAHTATLLADGRVLITGGGDQTHNAVNTAELYDPTSGTFATTGNMVAARSQHTAALLANGTVLLAGGDDNSGNLLATAEIYDPSRGAFAPTGSMSTPRIFHTQSQLPNGKVLVAGGTVAFVPIPGTPYFNGTPTATAELYDQTAGTFSLTGSLTAPVGGAPAAAVLTDGNVLVTNGSTSSNVTGDTAEVYNTTNGTFALTGSLPVDEIENVNSIVLLNDGTVLNTGGSDSTPAGLIYYSTAALAPISITTTALANGVQGKSYTQILLEQGGVGNLTWTETGTPPAGMTFNAQGVLFGTPTAIGSFPLTFTVTDSSSPAKTTTSGTLTLVVTSPLTLGAQTLPTAGTGSAYATSLTGASGGIAPYSFAVTGGALPPGITLANNGALSGTPTTAGTFTFTVTATDQSVPPQSASQAFTINITSSTAPAITSVTPAPLPAPTSAGVSYTGTFVITGQNLQGAVVTTDGPLSLTGSPVINAAGTSISQEYLIGFGVPQQGQVFHLTVNTPGGSASIADTIALTGQAPASVVFVAPPQTGVEGQVLSSIQVLVSDATGAPIANLPVTIGFNGAAPCAAASLSGTLTQNTSATGTATFADLSINRGQFAFTLAATAGTVSAISIPFNVEGYCETGSLATARAFHSSVALPNGKVLAAGGTSSGNFTGTFFSSAELYDPSTHTFATISSMNAARAQFTMALLQNGLVLVAGGFDGTNALSSAELLDPSKNTFTLLSSSMAAARYGHVATLLPNGKVLITGGKSATTFNPLASAEIFDPSSNTFRAASGTMTTPRTFHEANLLVNGQVLISGGVDINFNPLASAEIYDPASDTFTATGSMATAREQHAAALLFNGTVLVAGGDTGTANSLTPTNTAEIYDPATGTFSATSNLTQSLAGFSSPVPVLPDGTVLIPEGSGSGNIQIYNPTTSTFRVTGNMVASQFSPPAALLQDGTVLFAGGQLSFPGVTSNSEIFYPANIVPIQITTALPLAYTNQPYSEQLQEQGGIGTLTWALTSGTLPAGITLSSSGLLAGTATAVSVSQFTVQVTDSSTPSRIATQSYILEVISPVLVVPTLPDANPGVPYSQTLTVVTGTAPFTFSLFGGSLPTGLTLASNGTVSGTTNVAPGTFTFVVKVSDSSSPPVSDNQTVLVSVAPPLAVTTTSLPNGNLGVAYPTTTIATSGGLAPVVFVVTAGTLPPGLSLGITGTLSGTPTTTGGFSFTVTAADASAQEQLAAQSYTITIN